MKIKRRKIKKLTIKYDKKIMFLINNKTTHSKTAKKYNNNLTIIFHQSQHNVTSYQFLTTSADKHLELDS